MDFGHGDAVIESAVPTDLREVISLYRAVGWTVYADAPDVLEAALVGSSMVVVARLAGALVGLARVVSDGATICFLQDVLVHPEAQRRGIGRRLVQAALQPYASVRQKVLLTGDEASQRAFYEALGYSETRDFGSGTLRAFVRFDNPPT